MKPLTCSILATLLSPTLAYAEPIAIPLTQDTLDLSQARSVTLETRAGRSAICLDGAALIDGVRARQGVLRADVLNTGRRAFAHLIFHVESAQDFEAAYLRLHKSAQPDALQYTPHIAGESHWQLLGDAQRAADFGEADWIPLEVAFNGDQARVRVGAGDQTDVTEMEIGDLRLDGTGEQVGLHALFGACFSSVSFDPVHPDLGEIAPAPAAPEGVIERWSVSPAEPFNGFPAQPVGRESWRQVSAEPDGLVYFARHTERARSGQSESNPEDVIYAAVEIEADQARNVRLQLDASDKARIWLNGRALAEFDNSFRRKGALFRGDVDPQAQTVYLPLVEGTNTLVIGVAERANGWGLAAILPDRTGLAVGPLAR